MPSVGDKAYEVEWYPLSKRNVEVAKDEDSGYDLMFSKFRRFPNKELAVSFAKRMASRSIFGTAVVRPVEYTDKYDCGFAEWHDLDGGRIEVSINASGGFSVEEC